EVAGNDRAEDPSDRPDDPVATTGVVDEDRRRGSVGRHGQLLAGGSEGGSAAFLRFLRVIEETCRRITARLIRLGRRDSGPGCLVGRHAVQVTVSAVSNPSSDTVIVERRGFVQLITINRPEAKNAL